MKTKILEIAPNLYNQLFKVNKDAPLLVKVLGLKDVGRFRDIFLNANGEKIVLYTRNGGNNRKEYQHIFDQLRKHPRYVRDWDDNYDNTYAYIEFTVPQKYQEELKKMATGVNPKSIGEKFKDIEKEMSKMTEDEMRKDPRFAPTFEMLEKALFEKE